MKIQEIRDELIARNLSSKGKIQNILQFCFVLL